MAETNFVTVVANSLGYFFSNPLSFECVCGGGGYFIISKIIGQFRNKKV